MNIPNCVPSLTEEQERDITCSLLQEINECFGVSLGTEPDMSRSGDPTSSSDKARIVLIGASHMVRIAEALSEKGLDIKNMATPGWRPTGPRLEAASASLRELNLTKDDIVLVDIWSNMAYMGSDESGLPKKVQKDSTDRRYHVTGHLQAAPKQVFQLVAKDCTDLFGAAGAASVMLLGPLPRYVTAKCCEDPEHLTNFGTDDMEAEIQRAEDNAAAAAGPALSAGSAAFFVYHDVFGSDKDLVDMAGTDGAAIWRQDDPVHLTKDAYGELGMAMVAAARQQPCAATRRERLESVVPGGNLLRGNSNVRPTAWVLGQAAPSTRGQRGSRFQRGGQRNSWRGRIGGRGRQGRARGSWRGRRGGGWYHPY